MMFNRIKARSIAWSIFAAAALVGFTLQPTIKPAMAQTVAIDSNDIGGVVTGPNGPEAGVWVIAETKDLGTRYIKAVVTDGPAMRLYRRRVRGLFE